MVYSLYWLIVFRVTVGMDSYYTISNPDILMLVGNNVITGIAAGNSTVGLTVDGVTSISLLTVTVRNTSSFIDHIDIHTMQPHALSGVVGSSVALAGTVTLVDGVEYPLGVY